MADDITRKEFLQAGVATLVATTLGACASDDGEGGEDGDGCTSTASANIAENHGHSLSIPAGDINDGAAQDYDIEGTANHNHTVSLSDDDMMRIAAGENVAVTSSTDGAPAHSHAVTVSC
jgi:hypothetical protein